MKTVLIKKYKHLQYLTQDRTRLECYMTAIQDKVINTKNYIKHIIEDTRTQEDFCRICHEEAETIEHMIAA